MFWCFGPCLSTCLSTCPRAGFSNLNGEVRGEGAMTNDKDSVTQEEELISNSADKIGESPRFITCFMCPACEEGQGVCAYFMVLISVLLIFVTMPFSLLLVVKVVQVRSSCNTCNWELLDLFYLLSAWVA